MNNILLGVTGMVFFAILVGIGTQEVAIQNMAYNCNSNWELYGGGKK